MKGQNGEKQRIIALYVVSCLDEKTILKMASQLPIAGESSDPLIFKKGRYAFDK